MKLNPDCVRDVLLAVESADLDEYISPKTLHNFLPLIIAMTVQLAGQDIPIVKSIVRLTYRGHELAAKIRDPERWPKLKKGLSSVRDYSISALSAVAEVALSASVSAVVSGLI